MTEEKLEKTSELLADVSVQDLMAEVQRRLDCARKPEKRLILIGPPGEQQRNVSSLFRPTVPALTLRCICCVCCCQAAARALRLRS
jgi:hypothetical protein